ncbi:hypothetical protein AB0383_48770 [Amycolatopsis sp. NPDC051373]|uniref:hypothetical protein n=1 Tax=Amycolatopsis sp. NPDC051373 TaxID=3155801 RepID=UPI00344F1C3A
MSQTIETVPNARAQYRPFLTAGEASVLMLLILVAGVLLGAFILPNLGLVGVVLTSLGYMVVFGMTIYLLVLALLDARRRRIRS